MNLERIDPNSQEYRDNMLQLAQDIALAQWQDKMCANFLNGLYTAPSVGNDIINGNQILDAIESLKTSLTPVTDFFAKPEVAPASAKTRISRKERARLEEEEKQAKIEAHLSMLRQHSLTRVKGD